MLALSQALERLSTRVRRGESLWPALRSVGPALSMCEPALARLEPPAPVREEWSRQLRQTRARNALLLDQLASVEDALGERGVTSFRLKGAYALSHIYDDPGLRPMDDADILIRPDERAIAAEVMARLGFRARPPEPGRFGPVDDPELHAEASYIGPTGVEIDVHWHPVADARVRALFPRFDGADFVLGTAVSQITSHPWSHPLGYLDIHLAGPIPMERARALGVEAAAYWAGRFTSALFGETTGGSGLADLLIGGDWLGQASWRREMAARDLFLLLAVGPRSFGRMAALTLGPWRLRPAAAAEAC